MHIEVIVSSIYKSSAENTFERPNLIISKPEGQFVLVRDKVGFYNLFPHHEPTSAMNVVICLIQGFQSSGWGLLQRQTRSVCITVTYMVGFY